MEWSTEWWGTVKGKTWEGGRGGKVEWAGMVG